MGHTPQEAEPDRPPVVKEGIPAEDLESFIRVVIPRIRQIECRQVPGKVTPDVKITDARTGQVLHGVSRVRVDFSPYGHKATVESVVFDADVEVEADVVEVTYR